MPAPAQSRVYSALETRRYPGCLGNPPVDPGVNINKLHGLTETISVLESRRFPGALGNAPVSPGVDVKGFHGLSSTQSALNSSAFPGTVIPGGIGQLVPTRYAGWEQSTNSVIYLNNVTGALISSSTPTNYNNSLYNTPAFADIDRVEFDRGLEVFLFFDRVSNTRLEVSTSNGLPVRFNQSL